MAIQIQEQESALASMAADMSAAKVVLLLQLAAGSYLLCPKDLST